MPKNFDKIMEFFHLSPEQKASGLKDVFEASVEFFEQFKDTMKSGSPEEKQKMMDEVLKMQQALQEETKRIAETTGMDEEKLKEFAMNPENFSEDQWRVIQDSKSKIEEQAGEIATLVKFKKPEDGGEPHNHNKDKEGPKKPSTRKGDWIRS